MTEPKIWQPPERMVADYFDLASEALAAVAAERDAALTENAGLREALEASEAECAQVIEERDRLRHGVDRVLARHAQLGTLREADVFDLERSYAPQPSNPGEAS